MARRAARRAPAPKPQMRAIHQVGGGVQATDEGHELARKRAVRGAGSMRGCMQGYQYSSSHHQRQSVIIRRHAPAECMTSRRGRAARARARHRPPARERSGGAVVSTRMQRLLHAAPLVLLLRRGGWRHGEHLHAALARAHPMATRGARPRPAACKWWRHGEHLHAALALGPPPAHLALERGDRLGDRILVLDDEGGMGLLEPKLRSRARAMVSTCMQRSRDGSLRAQAAATRARAVRAVARSAPW